MKKNKIIIISVISILVVLISFFSVKYYLTNKKLKDNAPIHCITNGSDSKIEVFYDFKNGEVYRYSIISTNKITDSFDINRYKELTDKFNNENEGAIEKVYVKDDNYIIMDIYNIDFMNDEDFKKLMFMSKEEFKSKSRKEIKDSVVPISANSAECIDYAE